MNMWGFLKYFGLESFRYIHRSDIFESHSNSIFTLKKTSRIELPIFSIDDSNLNNEGQVLLVLKDYFALNNI